MKTNYGTINRLSETLDRMSGLTGDPGYAIAKTKRLIRAEVEVFRELRDSLVKKYGTDTGSGIAVRPGDESWPEFLDRYTELCGRPVEVELYQVDSFDLDAVRCDSASADDYDIFEQFMVKRKGGSVDDKPDKSGADTEDAG